MWDILSQAFTWLLLIFFGGQAVIFVGFALWTVWIDAIKPRLIPADDIARVADDIIASYPDPELEAFARHERAWYDSDGGEQTYWYRVGRPSGRSCRDSRAKAEFSIALTAGRRLHYARESEYVPDMFNMRTVR